ncbi:NERD domain-containing protein [Halobacillus salinus]|uniref:NERD domain-containing protein n=1 Tax=Halobacillus salinus TaxID=192814 RepID=A0A4Z0H183_9BACI|nr:NERD domain-containing protein [Halobacillus salinus]
MGLESNSTFYHSLQEELLKIASGHHGEKNTDYYLQYTPDHMTHLKDIRLFDGIQHFQVDSLLTSDSHLTIIDVKNHKGKLIFDFDNQQLIRDYKGQKDYYTDPFIQVEHHKLQLTRWLHHHNFPQVPIEPYIIISNPQTVLKTHGRDAHGYKNRIIRAKRLPHLLNKLPYRQKPVPWNSEERERFHQFVQKKNTPFTVSVVKNTD